MYQASRLSVGLSLYNTNNPAATATSRTTTLAANYDAGFATFYGDVQLQRRAAAGIRQ